ncbi:unnamed protein product [Meloidogyne enterolobii]|uniref:Uncharacterized protein n=3 Tax=Meloidogyne enterolobii TaxID=390850 RepID=A0A6V7XSD3_MELEN|nr:unnamed protein product [Meloidogyne enterolobii]
MSDVHAVEKLWMGDGIEPYVKGPDRGTTDCASIQPNVVLFFSFMFFLQVRTQQYLITISPPFYSGLRLIFILFFLPRNGQISFLLILIFELAVYSSFVIFVNLTFT